MLAPAYVRWHGRLFRLSAEQTDAISYGGMLLYKTGILLFNLVSYIACGSWRETAPWTDHDPGRCSPAAGPEGAGRVAAPSLHPLAVAIPGGLRPAVRRVTAGAPPRADQLDRPDYLDAAVRESLRVRTTLPFIVRLTKTAFAAGGREYPPGVVLCPCNHLVHRREDLYPDPQAFRPERFLERRHAAHEWFPFGGGRMCLGMAFALYEMKVVLSTLFPLAHLTRPPGSRSAPVRRDVSLAPDDGALMTVAVRLRP